MKIDRIRHFKILSYAGHGINDLYLFILPLVLPMILTQYNLNYGSAGGIITIYLSTIALFSFVFGKLSDSLPRGYILGFGFFLASGAFCLAALASPLWLFIFCIVFAAIGVGTFHPVMYAVLGEYAHHNQGKMYGHFEFWGIVAIFSMFMLSGTLLRFLEWNYIIIISVSPGFLMGFLYVKNRPLLERHSPVIHDSDREESEGPMISTWLLVLFFATVILRIFSVNAILNFVPTYFVDVFHFRENLASYSTGLFFLGGLSASRLSARAGDRWGPLTVLLLVTFCLIPLPLLMSVKTAVWLLPCTVYLLGAFGAGAIPLQNKLLIVLGNRFGRGQIFGALMSAITFTNAFSPSILGVIADQIGLRATFRLFSLPVTIGWILLLFIYKNQNVKALFKDRALSL
jgi:MFS family permease